MARKTPNKRTAFLNEIRLLLHAFDADKDPQIATSIQEYMYYYITSVLHEAKNNARFKGKVKTDDILYVIKDDQIKLRRAKELLKTNEELKSARKAFEVEEEVKRKGRKKKQLE